MKSKDTPDDSAKERVNVYIDGFNLYRGIIEADLDRYLWLDLAAFATNLLRTHQVLATVYYYTAPVKGRRKGKHQCAFLLANSNSPDINVRMGEYVFNKPVCRKCGTNFACTECGRVYGPPTEKRSDVNLGTQLGLDAASDLFDTAIIVSSDSDFAGAIDLIEEYKPQKKVVVCLPPGRHDRGAVLAAKGAGSIHINESMLRNAQFPREVSLGDGRIARRPDDWLTRKAVAKDVFVSCNAKGSTSRLKTSLAHTPTRRTNMSREYVNFGGAGVKVTRMALGLGFRGQADATEAKKTIAAALDGGLNLIDCANIYGLGDDRRRAGTSEMILGEVMRDRGCRDDIVITSKVSSPVAQGVNDSNTSRWHIMREVERSLKRLQTDRIDVYLVHHFDDTVSFDERVRALEDLVRAGKVRYTGVCNYQAWQVAETLRVQDCLKASRLVTVQNPYSLLNRALEEEMFPMVNHYGIGIMAYSPLGVGLLSGTYGRDSVPDRPTLWGGRRSDAYARVMRGRVADVVEANVAVASEVGATPAQVAQAWVLSHPEVSVSISGADTAEQMADNLGALDLELDDAHIERLDAVSDRLRVVLDGSDFESDR